MSASTSDNLRAPQLNMFKSELYLTSKLLIPQLLTDI